MKEVIDLGYGDAIVIIKRKEVKQFETDDGLTFVTVMAPSYLDENVYSPAESIQVTMDKKRVIKLRNVLNKVLKEIKDLVRR